MNCGIASGLEISFMYSGVVKFIYSAAWKCLSVFTLVLLSWPVEALYYLKTSPLLVILICCRYFLFCLPFCSLNDTF